MKKTDSKKTDLKKKNELKSQVALALAACEDKKAEQITVLELEQNSGAFTDYFLICSGTNPRQVQAISDEVELRLKRSGLYPNNIEGHRQGEWVLIDYVDFVVHIFSETARKYYDLERLWKSAKKIEPADFVVKPRKRSAARSRAKKPA
ncbi:MAG TPA: ribosome silencing factor [Terriglobales bacterium]|jgi:ribosome-associated protein|nr:ribosome silencing factor [Terriglobales bacterium]